MPLRYAVPGNKGTAVVAVIVAVVVAGLVVAFGGGARANHNDTRENDRDAPLALPYRAELFAAGFDSALGLKQRPGDNNKSIARHLIL